ncbi:MAG: YbaB/EbfC family nucleoid-associated protein [Candidatus Promineofilum sp.]|nr:YbaB/EbfC family nucleoid-associated protein [Promineifilum sp.]MCW5862556.1 YbaB/EbfC family nucleoid-associated protein [Anaerolineae bacterium]
MTKRNFHGKPAKKKGAGGNPNDMLAQVQKMQQDMATAQTALENETLTVSAGGGAITIVITGHQRVRSIAIDKELLTAEEAEFLQDMLVAGINAAIEQSQALAAQRMEGITGGVGGMDGLLDGLMG